MGTGHSQRGTGFLLSYLGLRFGAVVAAAAAVAAVVVVVIVVVVVSPLSGSLKNCQRPGHHQLCVPCQWLGDLHTDCQRTSLGAQELALT